MADEPVLMTLKQRIASLNAAQVGRVPADNRHSGSQKQKALLQPPALPRKNSINLPVESVISTTSQPRIANLPKGPPPLPTRRPPPPLPSRSSTKDDIEKIPVSGSADITAPKWSAQLSVMPKRQAAQPRPSNDAVGPDCPVRPPVLQSHSEVTAESMPRRVPPIPSADMLEKAKKASFSSFPSTNNVDSWQRPVASAEQKPLPDRRFSTSPTAQPPLVPLDSRPEPLNSSDKVLDKITLQNSDSYPHSQMSCMTCRDFSAADHQATLFPRQKVRDLRELAWQLTSPFDSLTDKARAIFTWMHLNIDYNVQDFFSGNLKASTPQSTLQTGLAVCEGYAALYTNIASHAGLESIVVSGHGKGFGHQPLAPGSPLPPYNGNHAWNVVKIDGGEWKLIDSCWGAGHVTGAGQPYTRKFAPEKFTQSNEEFGISHFPNNRNHFFRADGNTMSWAEYIQTDPDTWPYDFERPTFFDNAKNDYSIGRQTLKPPCRQISVQQPGKIRFQFGLFCAHWTSENHTKKGLPPVFILAIGGVGGRNKDFVPLQHISPTPGRGGDMWYVDVSAQQLGAPGETLTLFAVTTFGSRQDARGLTVEEFKQGKGRTAMGFVGVAAWELI